MSFFKKHFRKNKDESTNDNMPHATATVNGVVVAETDKWEVVDGNIYVCFSFLFLGWILFSISYEMGSI